MNRHTHISFEQKALIFRSSKKSDIFLSDETMDEDEMLRKAIAMSLEEETGVGFLKKEKTRLSTISFRWHAGRENGCRL